MGETIFGKIKVNLFGAVTRVNNYASEKDTNRNHTNYGAVTAYADILRELGHEIEIACWEDDGYLKIEKVTINENSLKL
ncbi:MAG: hypothetical protein PHD60_01585 [Clostridia bacterium]|nr:hypothetical protein [Clostridia bacterium]